MSGNLGTVFGLIGSFFGPWGYAIGNFVGNVLDPQKGPNINGPRLDDLSVQTSSNAADLGRAYGTMATMGNMIWALNNELVEVINTTTERKKVLGFTVAKQNVTTYSYYLTGAFSFVKVPEGATAAIVRVWVGDRLVINNSSDNVATQLVSGNNAEKYFTFYLGTDDQLPDPTIAADVGLENCSGYPGTLYVVMKDFPLADFLNSVSRAALKIEYTMSFEAEGIQFIGNVPMPPGDDNYDEKPLQHNAPFLDEEGMHVWRSNQGGNSNFTKWEFLAVPGVPAAIQKQLRNDLIPSHLTSDYELLHLRNPAKGRSNVAVQVFSSGFTRQAETNGTPTENPSMQIPGQWRLTLYGFPWTTANGAYAGIVGTGAAYAPVADLGGGIDVHSWEFKSFGDAAQSLRNFSGPLYSASWAPDGFPGYMDNPARQESAPGGILWRDTTPLLNRFAITRIDDTSQIVPFPLTAAYWELATYRTWVTALVIAPNYSREYRIDVSEQPELPDATTFYASLGDYVYFAFTMSGVVTIGLLDNISFSDNTTISNPDPTSLIRMGFVNERLHVLVETGGDYFIHRLNLDLSTIDVLDETDIATAFGASTDEVINSLSFDYNAFRWLRDGNVYDKFELNGTSRLIGDVSADIIDGTTYPPFFSMTVSGHLLAVSTVGGAMDGPGVQFFTFGTVTPGSALLADIITAECKLAGLTEDDIDVSQIDQEVSGYRVSTRGSIRTVLQQLQACFPFDVVTSGYKLKFIPRGTTSVANVDWEDLGAGVQWTQEREQSTQLPMRVFFRYLDRSQEYEVQEQYSERPIDSEQEQVIEIPIVFTPDEAAQRVDVIHSIYLTERVTYGPFLLPPPYRYLEPSDVITVVTQEATYSVRLTDITYQSDGALTCMGTANAVPIYASTAVGESPPPADDDLNIAGPVITLLMDLPRISFEDSPGITAAMSGVYENWVGGELWRTTDNGTSWTSVAGFTDSVTLGVAETTLSAKLGVLPDLSGVLTIQLFSGTLSTVTEEQWYNETLLFAYGQDDRWEIISAQTVVDNGDRNYTLTKFLRGLRGTEWATGLHEVGDSVVLLNDPDLQFVALTQADINTLVSLRGANAGQSIESQPDSTVTYDGVNLEPLSGTYANAVGDSESDIFITWLRRDRDNFPWISHEDMPMTEAAESYEVDILSAPGGSVKRTLTSNISQVEYTSAQQIADFGAEQMQVSVSIYQMSALVGRGYPLTITLPLNSSRIFSVWNSADMGPNVTLSNGDKTASKSGAGYQSVRGSVGKSSGKRYFEITAVFANVTNNLLVGIADASFTLSGRYLGESNAGAKKSAGYWWQGQFYRNLTNTASSASVTGYGNGAVIGVLVDFATFTISFINTSTGATIGSYTDATPWGTLFPAVTMEGNGTATLNASGPFVIAALPSGSVRWDN